LPPVRSTRLGNSSDRSPYLIDLSSFIGRFATSPQRLKILDGLLRFRADLYRADIVSGFQWLDGSFLEQIEVLENRAPRDLDVVNFLDLTKMDQSALVQQHQALFDNKQVKEVYALDTYLVQIGGALESPRIS